MNLNQLAREICKREGKKKQVDIAQVKEVLRVMHEILVEEADVRDAFKAKEEKGELMAPKQVREAVFGKKKPAKRKASK